MKTTILFALILTLCFSCKPKEGSEEEAVEVAESPTLVDQMQGSYETCMPSLNYAGYYSEVKISVVDNLITKSFTLSTSANCSSPYYVFESVAEISLASVLSESPLKVAVDLKVVSYKFTDLHGWYSTQNYCGLNTWAVNVTKDVTGLNCPNLKVGPSGTTYLNANDLEYESMIIGTNSISIVLDENETGLTNLTRKLTGLGEVPKI
jgi:hypothetical protein